MQADNSGIRAVIFRPIVPPAHTCESRRLSVAIPTFCRSPFRPALASWIGHPAVAEVVICDDASPGEHYENLCEQAARTSARIRLRRNPGNLGAYWNKAQALALSTSSHAILLDDDNDIDRAYIDRLCELPEWAPDTIYCPALACPDHDFTELAGVRLDLAGVRDALGSSRPWLVRKLLNTGNFLVPVQAYLACARGLPPGVDVLASDVIALCHRWLNAGGRLEVVAGLHYQHRRSADGLFDRTRDPSSVLVRKIAASIRTGGGWSTP